MQAQRATRFSRRGVPRDASRFPSPALERGQMARWHTRLHHAGSMSSGASSGTT